MADPWADFETIRHQIKNNTVDRLKHIANGLNDQCSAHITKSGKKQDLIDRVIARMDGWRKAGHSDKWARAKIVLAQVRDSGVYNRPGSLETASPSPSVYGSTPQSLNSYATSISPGKLNISSGPAATINAASIVKYDPYAPPRKVLPGTTVSTISQPSKQAAGIRFRPSPFFRVDQLVSGVIECPESTGAVDRRSQSVPFTLTADQISKLRGSSPSYQLRLYCTSSMFYFSNPNAFRSSPAPCPIEFPPTCEVRINGTAITANLKGLKKKPGTAPPAELPLRHIRLEPQPVNRVEMVYVNSQQPIQTKKYYLVVYLVEVTTAEQLVDRLKKGKFRTLEEVKLHTFSQSPDDDDVVLGQQKLSLKCPLSYIRIETPCRSKHCVHPQCFDAKSWYQMMEQTTTWLCPVCEKELNSDDLIVDGFFQSILGEAPHDLDDVLIEANGEWHSADNKHGSKGWLQSQQRKHPPQSNISITAIASSLPAQEKIAATKVIPQQQVVSLCDSDEDEETFVKKELFISSTRSTPQSATTSSKLSAAVIDLTLDSDSDVSAADITVNQDRSVALTSPTLPANGKRKVREDDSNLYSKAPTPQRPRIEIPFNVGTGGQTQHHMNGRNSASGYGTRMSPVPPEPSSFGAPLYRSPTHPSIHEGLYSPNPSYHPLPRRPSNYTSYAANSYQLCNYSPRSPGGEWNSTSSR